MDVIFFECGARKYTNQGQMDYFALCDDFTLRQIFDALGDDAAAIIARVMLRATCRRFAAILPTSVSRYDFSWILAQSLIVARKFAQGRAAIVREIMNARGARTAHENVIAHWQHFQKCAAIGMSAENFALICAQYVDCTIDNLVRVLYSWTHSYSTYDVTLVWISSYIYRTMSYWSSESTITFLRGFLSTESLRFLDELTARDNDRASSSDRALLIDDRARIISDRIARNIKRAKHSGRAKSCIFVENAIIEIIARITIARTEGLDDPRIAPIRAQLERIFAADTARDAIIAHINARDCDTSSHCARDIPFDINFLCLLPRAIQEQCLREHAREWEQWCDMMFNTARATIPSDLLSHPLRALIVEEIARNRRCVTTHRATIAHDCLAKAYGFEAPPGCESSRSIVPRYFTRDITYDFAHNEASCYFALITIVHQSPETFAQTMRANGHLMFLTGYQIAQIIGALTNPRESEHIYGAYCATPRQNIAIFQEYVHPCT